MNRFIETLKAEHNIRLEEDQRAKIAQAAEQKRRHIAKTIGLIDSCRQRFRTDFGFDIPADYEVAENFNQIYFTHEGIAFTVNVGAGMKVWVKTTNGSQAVVDRRQLAYHAAQGNLG